jgi:hypothetical protein
VRSLGRVQWVYLCVCLCVFVCLVAGLLHLVKFQAGTTCCRSVSCCTADLLVVLTVLAHTLRPVGTHWDVLGIYLALRSVPTVLQYCFRDTFCTVLAMWHLCLSYQSTVFMVLSVLSLLALGYSPCSVTVLLSWYACSVLTVWSVQYRLYPLAEPFASEHHTL